MLVAILKYIGANKLKETFPDLWEKCAMILISLNLGSGTKQNCQTLVARCGLEHIAMHSVAFSIWMWRKRIVLIRKAKRHIGRGFEKMFETVTGSALFKAEGLDMQFDWYLRYIKEQLHDCEMQNMSDDVVKDYKAAVRVRTKHLESIGHRKWMPKTIEEVAFMDAHLPMAFTTIDDYWGIPLEARMPTLAVSSNQLPRLPWEIVMFGEKDAAM